MAPTSIWDEFEFDPRSPEHASLRASDADRDVAHHALGAAYGDGRLTREEFDQRSGRVLGARTLGELAALLSDLVPAGRRSAQPPALRVEEAAELQNRAVAAYRGELREGLWGFVSASLVCWVIWGLTSGPDGFPWPVFVMLGTGLHVLRLLVMRRDAIESQRRRLERKQRKALDTQERPATDGDTDRA